MNFDEEEGTPQVIKLVNRLTNLSFTVPKSYTMISGFVKTVFVNDPECKEIVLKFPDMYGECEEKSDTSLQLIVEYMNLRQGEEAPKLVPPLQDTYLEKIITDPLDLEFMTKLTWEQVQLLLYAANYLDIKTLCSYCAANIAIGLKRKDTPQILEFLETQLKVTKIPSERRDVLKAL